MRTVLASAVLLLAVVPAAQAQVQPTEAEQRQACTGDVLSYCAVHIPDRQRIGACLIANREKISDSCRAVIDAMRRNASPRRG